MCGGDGDDDDCWLPVITAPQAHMSLLSRQMMGHLCLSGATGIAGPFLTRLLITPSGHGKSQSRESRLDQCCPTRDLLSGCQSDMWLLLSSSRHDRRISGNTWEALLQFRDTHQALKERTRTTGLLTRSDECLRLHVRWWGVWGANADEVFLVLFPEANCPGY